MRNAWGILLLVACDGGMTAPDAGPMIDCTGMADGTPCGGSMICVGGACGASACGDGFIDDAAGEQCEDGNDVAFDGCDPDGCTFTCVDAAACADGDPCNGDESCAGDHTCASGTALPDDVACVVFGEDGVCHSMRCVVPGCPNGFLEGDEECDDGNVSDGDGCDLDCTFSCDLMTGCEDGNVCNGVSVCQLADHTCLPGTTRDCDDDDPCTNDVCDPVAGCQHPISVDADLDGFAPRSLGPCGTDCDDTDDTIYPGATELCDLIDQDCDLDPAPLTQPTWYLDCDGDGYAATGSTSMMQCDEPAPSGCGGAWTARAPVAGESDCNDGDADIRPRATEIAGDPGDVDEDCNGRVLCYADIDRDRARTDVEIEALGITCTGPNEAHASAALDCNDGDPRVGPGEPEECNARDDNCDGVVDEGALCGTCDVIALAGSVYLFCDESRSWTSARDRCRMYGYDLATIETMEENDMVTTTAFTFRDDDWWIGLHDQLFESTFVWSDGSPLGFTAWNTGQPDDAGGQDCVYFANGGVVQETRGLWNDFGCGNGHPYLCEIP